ncbi:nuclease-related domain-containing protein [Paracidovorax avenae]|uniref:nuclease-related domain-containing protein n=1 Tax=Paracidovorax avenae TaxID=80867 RepID=UPI000D17C2CE|nr:nuclease-related domain-containing protein [Paracidovorax avenae]
MNAGERPLAERLEQKLEGDYLPWWKVPHGPNQTRPDFFVLLLRRGALILEVKGWRQSTIRSATRECSEFVSDGQFKEVMSLLQQMRECAIQVVNGLELALVAQIRRVNGVPNQRRPAIALRRCAEHLPLHANEVLQPEYCGDPSAGLDHLPEDQLLEPAADIAVGLPHGWRHAKACNGASIDDGIPCAADSESWPRDCAIEVQATDRSKTLEGCDFYLGINQGKERLLFMKVFRSWLSS